MKKTSLIIGALPLLFLAACTGNQPQAQNPTEGNQPSQVAQQKSNEYTSSSAAPEVVAPTSQSVDAHTQPKQEQKPVAASYRAGAIQSYSAASYKQALADGKTVIIDFYANWCPICKANAPHIQAAFDQTNNTNVVGFIADYDTETALEDQFGVSSQSMLVKVKGSGQQKVGTLGPGPLTTEQVTAFIQS